MNKRYLQLLGVPHVACDEGDVPRFRSQRTIALLGYLVAERRVLTRAGLAALFWPDEPVDKGKANLRRELHNLAQILPDCWETDRVQVAFVPANQTTVDLDVLQQHADAGEWQAAAELLRGDFLEGINLDENPEFESWLLGERERWRQQTEQSLNRAVDQLERQGAYRQAIKFAQRLLQLMPWQEETHRRLMRLLALSGQRSAALKQFARCQQALAEELGVEVSADTLALYERIKTTPTWSLNNIPAVTTPLIGREQEVATLAAMVTNPEIRLVTITGMGGMGKTRLALGVAWQLAEGHFRDGVVFVALAAVESGEQAVTAIAQALRFPFSEQNPRTPHQQLVDYLRVKELLLILDNCEHLLQELDVVTELLQAAPQLRILATSRERLRLHGEHLFALQGLARAEERTDHPAAQLFIAAAQRVNPDFAIVNQNAAHINQICRMVDGMPLALELAAAWTDSLSPTAIAEEIKKSADILATDLRNLPVRHRSMSAVLDATWRRLSPPLQQGLAALSVFRGTFDLHAAQAIAQATAPMLAQLVSHSLLSFDLEAERYQLHELLRQYSQDKLKGIPEVASKIPDQHSRHYCALLASAVDNLRTIDKAIAQSHFAADFENICQAWDWALEHGQIERLQDTVDGFGFLLMRMNRYHEGAARFEQALRQVEAQGSDGTANDIYHYVFAQLLVWCGEFVHFLGDNNRAYTMLHQALEILASSKLENIETQHARATALYCLGDTISGEAAQRCYQQACELAKKTNDRWLEASALQALSSLFLRESMGSLEKAKDVVEQSLSIHRDIRDPWGISWNLLTLGEIALNQGDIAAGRRMIDESLQISQQLDLENQIARCYALYGDIALAAGEFQTANERYRFSVAMWHALNLPNAAIIDQCSLAWSLVHVGSSAAAHRAVKKAHRLLQNEKSFKAANDRFYFVSGLLALADGEQSEARQHFQLCMKLAEFPSSRGYAFCGLVLAARGLNTSTDARRYLDEAVKAARGIGFYLLTLHTLSVAALLLADAGDADYARELHVLLKQHPFTANSHWVKDVIDLPLEQAIRTVQSGTYDAGQRNPAIRQWCVQTKEVCQELVDLLPQAVCFK